MSSEKHRERAHAATLAAKEECRKERLMLGTGNALDVLDKHIAAALAKVEAETREECAAKIATADIVYHVPSREEWVVAWADHESGFMAPCGWPECQAQISDCVLIRAASHAARMKLADELAISGRRDAHKARAILADGEKRLDGGALTAAMRKGDEG